MRLFRRDLQRGLTGWMFWTAVALGLGLCLRSLIHLQNMDGLRDMPQGALNIFCFTGIFRESGYIGMVAPLIASLPFALAYQDDVRSGYLKFELMRMRPANYAAQRTLSTAVLGGMVFVVFFGTYLLLCLALDPGISLRGQAPELFVFKDIYAISMKAAIGLFVLQCFAFGACYALFAMGLSALIPVKIAVFLIPVLFHQYCHMLSWLLPIGESNLVMRMMPANTYSVMNGDWVRIFWGNGIVGILGLLLFSIGFIRWRRGNWMV